MPTHTTPERRTHPLPPETFEAIRQFDTCTVANAMERFPVRLRNVGVTRPGLSAITASPPRMLGWWGSIGLLPMPQSPDFTPEKLLEVIQ